MADVERILTGHDAPPVMSVSDFQTARLSATPLDLRHFEELCVLHKDAEVSKFLGGVRDETTTHQYITDNVAHWREYGFGTWALRDKAGSFAGRCALRHITINDVDEVEIGYTFHRAFWGQGLATEVSRKVLEMGFGALALPTIIAFAEVEHKASRHVMEKLGFLFEYEGEIKGALCALYRLHRLLPEHSVSSPDLFPGPMGSNAGC